MDGTWVDTYRLARRIKRPHEWALNSRPGIQFLDLGFAKLRLRIMGTGSPTVIFNCDPPNVIEHYDEIFNRLAPHTRVICFETPGFGFSYPKPGFRFTFNHYCQLVEDLLEALQLAPYVPVFPCMGGFIALKMAQTHPHFVERLVLTQLPSWSEELTWMKGRDPTGILRCPILGQLFTAAFPRWSAQNWYHNELGRGERFAHFTEISLSVIDHGAPYCLASTFQGFFKGGDPGFGEISQPTMVIWGTADHSHAFTDKKSVLAHVPHAEWHEFPNSTHAPELEEPAAFCDLLKAFCNLPK